MQRCCLARRGRTATMPAPRRRLAPALLQAYEYRQRWRRLARDPRRAAAPDAGRPGAAPPSQRLALAIAAEWDAQIDRIEPASMPLMALASTAIDQIPKERKQTEKTSLRTRPRTRAASSPTRRASPRCAGARTNTTNPSSRGSVKRTARS